MSNWSQQSSTQRLLLRVLFLAIFVSWFPVIQLHRSHLFTPNNHETHLHHPLKENTIDRSLASSSPLNPHLHRLPSPCDTLYKNNTSVSFVFAGRNDNYVGIYDRARLSIGVLIGQLSSILTTQSAEIIIVNWGNDPTRPSLFDEIVIPAVNSLNISNGSRLDQICIRCINVPLHLTDANFTFSEFVAKNVGIRRASGNVIVTSNLDNFFSPSLVRMAVGVDNSGLDMTLNEKWFVRAMRFNIDSSGGAVLWRGKYYRGSSLKTPATVNSVLDWMGDGGRGDFSLMESDFEKQNINYLSQYSRFDQLCLDGNKPNTEKLFNDLDVRDYSKAAGDFTLAPATAWYDLSGYLQVFKNNHLDGAQLCRFIQAGYKQVVLRPNRPCSAFVFHQRHEVGRNDRVEQNLGPLTGCAQEVDIEKRFAVFVDRVDWGWGQSQVFQEDVLMFVRYVSGFQGKSCHVLGQEKNCTSMTIEQNQSPPTEPKQYTATDHKQHPTTIEMSQKNVISFSLYGTKNRYTDGAIENAKLAPIIYPGWQMYIYHDNSVPSTALKELAAIPHVRLFNVSVTLAKTNSMAWRFLVALDPEISVYIIRDVDSRLSQREKAAVSEWLLGSNAKFHVMHDHPGHCGMPMQGGMWGGRVVLPEIKHVIYPNSTAEDLMGFWGDTKMLRDTIWPIVKQSVLHHDSFCCGKFNETIPSRPFPTKRANGTGEHVGSVYLPVLGGELRDRDKNTVLRTKECN